MATIRFITKIEGVPADVASVVLADPADPPTYGIRRTDTEAVVVAADTPMVRVAEGTYEYLFIEPMDGVPYTAWVNWTRGSESHHREIVYTAKVTPPAAVLELSNQDQVMIDDVSCFLREYGEDVIVYPPAGDLRQVIGIVTRSLAGIEKDPRAQGMPIALQLPNSATAGISGAEWNNKFQADVPRYRGGPNVRMRTVRATYQDAAFITWELA
jgi:hypothetical protein